MKRVAIIVAAIFSLLSAATAQDGRFAFTKKEAVDKNARAYRAIKSGDRKSAIGAFYEVATKAPRNSDEYGAANLSLGRYAREEYKLTDAKEYARRSFNSGSRVAPDAGIFLANLYLVEGKKTQAAEALVLVKQRFPGTKQADQASFSAGMCYIGLGRTDKANRDGYRRLALRSLAESSDPEARIQELGILWEMARDSKVPWKSVLTRLDSFADDFPDASESAKARSVLMQSEQALIKGEHERSIELADKVIEVHPESKIEYFLALYTKSGALKEMGRDLEAIAGYDEIIRDCRPAWNFAGNNVQQSATYWKIQSQRKLGLDKEATETVKFFRSTWPEETFYTPFLLEVTK